MERLWQQIDSYCERLDPGFWAEPVNALTNLAILVAALVMWPRTSGLGRGLAAVLFVIGVGSWLFHTHAQVWAAIADVVPIAVFILLFMFALHRDVLGLHWGWAGAATLAFLPYAALTVPLWQHVPFYGGSAAYLPVPTLIVIYAGVFWRRRPDFARGMLIGALILMASLTARAADLPLCDRLPLGTHFLWHILNAIMLGWMIAVYTRARSRGDA